jgi:plastocyanin
MRVFLALAILAATVSCGSDSPATTPTDTKNLTYDVLMIGDAFSPFSQTIAPNDTIRWNFSGGSDGLGHNVRFFPKVTGAPADLPVQKTGTASSVFKTKGEFRYVCDVHPGMIGQIVVQ